MFRAKGRTESLQSSGRVELVDFPFHLLRNKLALKIYEKLEMSAPSPTVAGKHLKCIFPSRNNAQCSCFPVKVWPGARVPKLVWRMGSSFVSAAAVVPAEAGAACVVAVTSLS